MIEEKKREYFKNLQVLKALMFFGVFLSHSGSFFEVNGMWGACAVEIFFVISGFISASKYVESHDRGSLREGIQLLLTRYKKYYLLYFIVFCFSIPVERPFLLKNFLANLFMIQSYCGSCKIAFSYNWISWFLSTILFCYFVDSILNKLRIKFKDINLCVVLIVFSLQCIWSFLWKDCGSNYGIGQYFVYIFPPARVLDYFMGMLLFSIYEKNKKKTINLIVGQCFEVLVVIIFFCINNMTKYIPDIYLYTLVWVPIAMGTIWIFIFPQGHILKLLVENRFLLELGDRVFSFYIIHRMILVYANYFWGSTLFSWLSALTITLVIGYNIDDIIKDINKYLKKCGNYRFKV